MIAAVLQKVGVVSCEEVPNPVISDGDILVKVKAATICGTDLRIIRGKKTKGVRIPSIIGHEFSGEVVEIGSRVTAFSIGDFVTADPVLPCGNCFYCMNNMENVCLNRQAIGYEFDGSFAEYVCIPEVFIKRNNILLLDPSMSLLSGALAEPLACCINGQNNLNIRPGDTVVIAGAGPIGLMHVMLAKVAGASTVIVSEPNAMRRNMAKTCGADLIVDPLNESIHDAVMDVTGGYGADVVILAIGIPQLVNTMLAVGRKGARISLFAGFAKGDLPPIDVNLIHYNELFVVGASALKRNDLRTAVKLMEKGMIQAELLVSHQIPLEKFEKAVLLAESGEAVKVALIP